LIEESYVLLGQHPGQLSLQQLPCRTFRNILNEVHRLRAFEVCQSSFAKVDDLLLGHRVAFAHDHDGEACKKEDPAEILREIDGRIRGKDQKGACVAARRYCELAHEPKDLFALLLGHAVSEDGALHAEKYFRTAQDEHATARASHRTLYVVALTRVMASHYGFAAPGCEEARKLLVT